MTLSPPIEPAPTLLFAPIELAGNWGHMRPRSTDLVIGRMRHLCLDGVRPVSDRQPTFFRYVCCGAEFPRPFCRAIRDVLQFRTHP